MATDPDPAPLLHLAHDEFRQMVTHGHKSVPRLSTLDGVLAALIGTHFAHRVAESDLAARTTERDQALAERDALRKELDALRAARPAPRGDKVRELVELSRLWLNAYPQRSFWTSEYARRFYDLMRQFPTDADLAPDPVVQKCVEACKQYASEYDANAEAGAWRRVLVAGLAARAKGGA